MRIGLSYDLKSSLSADPGAPEDSLEEYDSEETICALTLALEKKGHKVVQMGGGRQFLQKVLAEPVDFVLNISEGLGNYRSREAQVPSVLEMLGIPYSGADPLTLAVCLDKPLTKQIVAAAGVATPEHSLVSSQTELLQTEWTAFPCLIKPVHEGSSKGVSLKSLVMDKPALMREATTMLTVYHQPVMIEEFIAGDEITVGVLGQPPRVLGIMRVVPRQGHNPNFIYCLEVKRDWEALVEYECPARLPAETSRLIEQYSLKAFDTLGCRDVARLDFRVNDKGQPYFIEANPLPGLRPGYSDLPMMAAMMGYDYDTLISIIVDCALERNFECVPK